MGTNLQGCRPFAWLLRRFRNVYEDGGLVPPEIFMLQEEQTGKCLLYQGPPGTSYDGHESAMLDDCNEENHRFFWHLGNTNFETGKCCNGLRAWNTDQCLEGAELDGGTVATGICMMNGQDLLQQWSLQEDKSLRKGDQCLGLTA